MRLETDGVDAGIGTASAGELLEALEHRLLIEIEQFGPRPGGQPHPLRHMIDRDHTRRSEQKRTADRHLTVRAATPDGKHVAR